MATAITLPSEYGYVLVSATSTFFINTLHAILTSARPARRPESRTRPTFATAEQAQKDPKAYKFNCAQRAHANFTENLTPFLGALLVSGLKYPTFAAGAGLAWSLGRVLFALGYVRNGPSGRMVGGALASLTDFALKGAAAYAALGFALGW